MNVTRTTVPPRRRARRVLAAAAAVGLAVSLSACSTGDSDDSGADSSSSSSEASPSESAAAATDAAPADAPAPTVGVDALVLNSADVPELGLAPVPAEQIAGGLDMIGNLTEGVTVEPESCADMNEDALTAQTEPGAMAIQSGQQGDTAYAVAVTAVDDGIADRAGQIGKCPVMTVTFPMEGQEMSSVSTNTLLDVAAPEGVENFAAVLQDNSMNMMGQTVSNGNLMITGTVRGMGISVTATSTGTEVSPEVQAFALDLFAKQAAKVRDAA